MTLWTSELCKLEALKYSRKSDWYRVHQPSYAAAQRNGWFDSCVTHMTEGNFSRTKEQCFQAASTFSTRNAFKHGDAKSYAFARREGWLDDCCAHMEQVRQTWSEEVCVERASKYATRAQWKRTDPLSYAAAVRLGFLDICGAHMTQLKTSWTLPACIKIAKGFTRRVDWKRGHKLSYTKASAEGWLEQCCGHMENAACRWSSWKEAAAIVHDSKYTYDEAVYVTKDENIKIICPVHGAFEQSPHNHLAGKGCRKCSRTGPSKSETELFEFVSAIAPDTYQSDRTLTTDGKELDIVIPSKNIAIEFNGLIWHSARFDTARNYHQAKSDAAAKVGLRLIHIWEDEWVNKRSWVEAFLRLQLSGPARKIAGRKCVVANLDTATARAFHDMYHLQGYKAGEHFGVYADDELVALCTVKNDELIRWTVKFDLVVIGGLSKVIKHVGRNLFSFCDTAKHDGSGYKTAGFEVVDAGHVGYWYTDGKQRVNRMHMQKHKLLKAGATGATEQELAASLGFYQIGGCRQLKLRYSVI